MQSTLQASFRYFVANDKSICSSAQEAHLLATYGKHGAQHG